MTPRPLLVYCRSEDYGRAWNDLRPPTCWSIVVMRTTAVHSMTPCPPREQSHRRCCNFRGAKRLLRVKRFDRGVEPLKWQEQSVDQYDITIF